MYKIIWFVLVSFSCIANASWIHQAIRSKNPDLIELARLFLILHPEQRFLQDESGRTPEDIALELRNFELAAELAPRSTNKRPQSLNLAPNYGSDQSRLPWELLSFIVGKLDTDTLQHFVNLRLVNKGFRALVYHEIRKRGHYAVRSPSDLIRLMTFTRGQASQIRSLFFAFGDHPITANILEGVWGTNHKPPLPAIRQRNWMVLQEHAILQNAENQEEEKVVMARLFEAWANFLQGELPGFNNVHTVKLQDGINACDYFIIQPLLCAVFEVPNFPSICQMSAARSDCFLFGDAPHSLVFNLNLRHKAMEVLELDGLLVSTADEIEGVLQNIEQGHLRNLRVLKLRGIGLNDAAKKRIKDAIDLQLLPSLEILEVDSPTDATKN